MGAYTPYVVLLIGLLVTIIGGYYAFVRKIETRVTVIEERCQYHQSIIDSIATLNQRIEKVSNDNEVFWKVIGPHMENIIHSPKSVDRDSLVAKLTRGTIGKEELPTLIEMLHEAIGKDEWTSEKRFAGVLLLARATALLNDERYERRR
jgi:hypothetical protein